MKKTSPKKDTKPKKRERLTQEERRSQLLNCAMKIFAKHGLDAANHALVAEDAKVSVPTVFFYFGSREKLVDAVLSEVERSNKLKFNSATKSKQPAIDTLFALSEQLVTSLSAEPYHSRIFLEWSIMARSNTWPRFLKLNQLILDTLIKIIKRGQREGSFRLDINPEDEAYILHACSYSMSQMQITGCSNAKIERYRRSVLDTVLLPANKSKAQTSSNKTTKAARKKKAK